MQLLLPESGLLFWMLLSFGVVVVILVKFGFPVILKMVEDRKAFIEESLILAQRARDEVDHVRQDADAIIQKARAEHADIIREANLIRDGIVNEAREKALTEGERILKETRMQVEMEKERAMHDIRQLVADMTLHTTEKLLRRQLDNQKEQKALIDRLLEDVEKSQS